MMDSYIYRNDYLFLRSKQHLCNEAFSNTVRKLFKRVNNPFEFCLFCFKNYKEEYIITDNSLPFKVIKELCSFLSISINGQIYEPFLTLDLQQRSIDFLKNIKISRQNIKYFVNCFCLDTIDCDIILPMLYQYLLAPCSYLENIISLIIVLKYVHYFDFDDLLIPLLQKNKKAEINEIIEMCPDHRNDFLTYLDQVVGNEIETFYFVTNGKRKKFTTNEAFNLSTRILRRYNYTLNGFSNILIKHNKNCISFLFRKFYVEEGITWESLLLFVEELSEEYELKVYILDLFASYSDYEGAHIYLEDESIDEEDIPYKLQNCNRSSGYKHHYRKKGNFYRLQLPFNQIIFVDTVNKFKLAINYLSSCVMIGVDCEWKPTIRFDKDEEFSLLQMATRNRVYIFDMINLNYILKDFHWNKLGMIFSNKNITKLSFSFSNDEQKLSEFNEKLDYHINRLSNMIDLEKTKSVLIKRFNHIFPYEPLNLKGLSELVCMCFGKPLNKVEQFSFWSIRPLYKGQLIYAALDSYCLIDIYDYIANKTSWRAVKAAYSYEMNNP